MPTARALREGVASFASRAVRAVRTPGLATRLAPLVLPLVLAPWLVVCADNYLHGLLYRDSPMFLYVAWCVRHGERLYQTVAMPDGPFACVIHLVLQVLGGANTDAAFRSADLWLHIVGGGVAGALLVPARVRSRVLVTAVWAVVGSALWVAAHFHWGFAASSQREAYYSLFTFLGFALWYGSVEHGRRGSAVALVLGGVLAALPVFGKPTQALFVAAALAGLALDPTDAVRSRRARVGLAVAGLGAGAALMVGFVALFGSLRGYWFWSVEYVDTYYRFHDWRTLESLVPIVAKDIAPPAILCMLVGSFAIPTGLLPPRVLGFAATPALALLVGLLQHKGWKYHYIPAAMMTTAFATLLMVRAWHAEPRGDRRVWAALTVALVAWLGLRSFEALENSDWLDKAQRHEDDGELRDARKAAAFVFTHTAPGDRMFYFGHLVEIPFFAERRPATPYVVPWLFMGGKGDPLARAEDLTAAQRQRIDALKTRLRADLCASLRTSPPPILATSDDWCQGGDCVKELGTFCPELPELVAKTYGPPETFGQNRVFLAIAK
jgi:hypothetical protein